MSATVEEIEKNETKNELLLDSLEIKGYRCFEHLTIEKLGRVNLIVGKNNVGKTALLEALWIFANGGYERLMFEILRERNEIPPYQNGNTLVQPESSKGLRNLFFNRPNFDFIAYDYPEELDNELRIQIGLNVDFSGEEPKFVTKVMQITGIRPDSNDINEIPRTELITTYNRKIENHFIKANGLTDKKLIEFWDNIEKRVLEDLVIKALKVITPNLLDIRFSGYPTGSFSRIPVVRLEDAKERVPLRSLGDGMTRLLGIASALINCENGILLVDEIESGLHYSVLPDVWKLIFKTAKDLNVQVFATTHSKDCIEAFTQAAIDDEESDGMLIRLENKNGAIKAKIFDEENLETITRRDIEVR